MDRQHDHEDNIETQPLPDLPLSNDQAGETTAGAGTVAFIGPATVGVRVGAVDR